MPNSYVNNDGKPNLNNSNAENENDARLAVWCMRVGLMHAFEPAANHPACFAQACLDFKYVRFVGEFKLKDGSQVQRCHLGQCICFEQIACLHRFGSVFCQQ